MADRWDASGDGENSYRGINQGGLVVILSVLLWKDSECVQYQRCLGLTTIDNALAVNMSWDGLEYFVVIQPVDDTLSADPRNNRAGYGHDLRGAG